METGTMPAPSEPIRLREWKASGLTTNGRLFTCGRPGRATSNTSRAPIGSDVIDRWVAGLPLADELHLVSLLGRKPDGFSEFGYYPFRSVKEAGSKPTFQAWLDSKYTRRFKVHEFPTRDRQGIPADLLKEATSRVRFLLEAGHTVVVVDSAGAERTSRVCEALGYDLV